MLKKPRMTLLSLKKIKNSTRKPIQLRLWRLQKLQKQNKGSQKRYGIVIKLKIFILSLFFIYYALYYNTSTIKASWNSGVSWKLELEWVQTHRLPNLFMTNLCDYLENSPWHLAPSPHDLSLPPAMKKQTHLLKTCSRVFLRDDSVRKSLQLPYTSPHSVICRDKKNINNHRYNSGETKVSIDRLKPAYVMSKDVQPSRPTTPKGVPLHSSGHSAHYAFIQRKMADILVIHVWSKVCFTDISAVCVGRVKFYLETLKLLLFILDLYRFQYLQLILNYKLCIRLLNYPFYLFCDLGTLTMHHSKFQLRDWLYFYSVLK